MQILNNLWLFYCHSYVLTFLGCDSTSSFYGKGKKTVWDTLQRNPGYVDVFLSLGCSLSIADDVIKELNRFVCLLYGDTVSKDVNSCRYTLFKSGKCSDDQLPPTCDSLLQHIYRANYQAVIWRRCLEAKMAIPAPTQHGWRIVDGQLQAVWMTRPPAPDAVLECVHCGCKTGCRNQRCSCIKANMRCTDICTCVGCTNAHDEEGDGTDDDLPTDNDEFDGIISDEDEDM